MSVNQDYIVENGIPVSPVVKMKLPDGSTLNLLDFFYPVGTYYETSDSDFDPNTVWGGTWVQDSKGKVLVGKSDSGIFSANNNTIGNESINLTLGQLPSHSHTYNEAASVTDDTTLSISQIPSHSHEVGAHTHTIGAHSHPYNAISGSTTDDCVLTINQIPLHSHTYDKPGVNTGSHTLTAAESGLPKHKHGMVDGYFGVNTSKKSWTLYGMTSSTSNEAHFMAASSLATAETNGTNASSGHNHSISTSSTNTGNKGSNYAHNHGISTISTQTSPATGGESGTNTEFNTSKSGSSQAHNHNISITQSNSGSIGSGNDIDIIQPSKVCIRWHRTA